jgi:hypothetical protein
VHTGSGSSPMQKTAKSGAWTNRIQRPTAAARVGTWKIINDRRLPTFERERAAAELSAIERKRLHDQANE